MTETVQKLESPKEPDQEEPVDVTMKDSGIEEYILHDGPVNRHAVELLNDSLSSKNTYEDTLSNISELSGDMWPDELLRHKLSELQLKLEEMTKTVAVEREWAQNSFYGGVVGTGGLLIDKPLPPQSQKMFIKICYKALL